MDVKVSRTRERFENTGVTVDWKSTINGVVSDSGSVQAGWVGTNKTFSDWPHDHFHQRLRRGEIVMGDLEIVTEERTSDYGDWSVTFPLSGYTHIEHRYGHWAQFFSSAYPLPSMYTPYVDGMANSALLKAYAKMNESSVMSGELLAELDATVRMLRRPFGSAASLLNKILRAKKRRLGRSSANAAKASAAAWLEYRYGWKPLMMDAETIIQDCYKLRSSVMSKRLVARASEKWSGKKSQLSSDIIWSPEWTLSGAASKEISLDAFAGVLYEVDPQTLMGSSSQFFGTSARDLPATAWELVPFSFVVDWFVGVGNFLQATLPRPGIKVLGNWMSARSVTTREYDVHLRHKYGLTPSYLTVPLGKYRNTTTLFQRKTNSSLPLLPALDQRSITALHSVDGLALSLKSILGSLAKVKH